MSSGSKKKGKEVPTEGTYLSNPIYAYKNLTGLYPSNSQVWWAYKRPLELGTQEPPKNYIEVFDPQLRHQISSGNTPAGKGHYILNAFRQDRSKASGVGGIPIQDSNFFRPTATAFMAGRVFYAGVNTAGYNTKIYFSQILERPDQIQFCYQSADPTAEDIRDLLPSDGGVIVAPDIAEIRILFVVGQALFVGASNGVWQISGSEGIGFKANDYTITKVSGTPVLSSMSFVFVEGVPFWWNRSGIWTLSQNQLGQSQISSLTDETIKGFFDEIPATCKEYAKGAYDPSLKRIQWLYRSTEPETDADKYVYDTILNLDMRTGAFYPFQPVNVPRVSLLGLFDVEGYQTEQIIEEVVVSGEPVVVEDEEVIYLWQKRSLAQSVLKYIIDIKDDTVGIPEPPPVPDPVIQEVVMEGTPVVVNDIQVLAWED